MKGYANAFEFIETGAADERLVTKIQSNIFSEAGIRICHFFSTTGSAWRFFCIFVTMMVFRYLLEYRNEKGIR